MQSTVCPGVSTVTMTVIQQHESAASRHTAAQQHRKGQHLTWELPGQARGVRPALAPHQQAQQPLNQHEELSYTVADDAGAAYNGLRRTHRRASAPARPTPPRSPPPAAHAPYTPQQLTQDIKQAASWQQLHALVSQHAPAMNFIHAAAAISKLPKLWPPPSTPRSSLLPSAPLSQEEQRQALLCVQVVCQLASQHTWQFQPRAVANTLWAASKLITSLHSLQDTTTPPPAYFTQAMPLSPVASSQAGADCSPGPSIAAAHTLALQTAQQLMQRLLDMTPNALPGFEPQHSANSLYALALLHTCAHTDTAQSPASPAQLTAASPPWTSQQLRQLADDVLRRSQVHMNHMTPQGASNMLWAAAQLGITPDEAWMDITLDTLQLAAQRVEPQHASMTIWALAKLGFFPGEDWVEQVLDQAGPQLLTHSSPQSLANTLWGLAVLEVLPAPLHLQGLLRAVCQQAPQFCAQDVSNVVWALAVWCRAAKQGGGAEQHSNDLSDILQFNDQGVASETTTTKIGKGSGVAVLQVVVPATGSTQVQQLQQGARSSTDVQDAVVHLRRTAVHVLLASAGLPRVSTQPQQQQQQLALAQASPQQLANIIWAASVLRIRPPAAWWRAYWRASYLALPLMSSQEVSNTLLGLARLGTPPPPVWWERCCKASARQLLHATPQHLAMTCWSLASLDLAPSPTWLSTCMFKMRQLAGHLDPGSCACCIWALAKLNQTPGVAWVVSLLSCDGAGVESVHPPTSPSGSSQPADSDPDTAPHGSSSSSSSSWCRYTLKQLAMLLWGVARLSARELGRWDTTTTTGNNPSKVQAVQPDHGVSHVSTTHDMLQAGPGSGQTLAEQAQHRRRLFSSNNDGIINLDADSDDDGMLEGWDRSAASGMEQPGGVVAEGGARGLLDAAAVHQALGHVLQPALQAVQGQLQQVMVDSNQAAPGEVSPAGGAADVLTGSRLEVARAVALITWSVSQLMPVLVPQGATDGSGQQHEAGGHVDLQKQKQQRSVGRQRKAGSKGRQAAKATTTPSPPLVYTLLPLLCDVACQHMEYFTMQQVVQLVVGLAGCKHQVQPHVIHVVCTHVHKLATQCLSAGQQGASGKSVGQTPVRRVQSQVTARQIGTVVKAAVAGGWALDREWVKRSVQLVAALLHQELHQQEGSSHSQLSSDRQVVMARRFVIRAPEWQLLQSALLQYDITFNVNEITTFGR